jgi:AcrR family transcriptional regulator
MDSPSQRRGVGRPPSRLYNDVKVKDTILAKSILVFSEQGLSNFSLKDISLMAEVSPAIIYYYFHTKEKLVEETLDTYLFPLIESYWVIMNNEDDPVELLKALQERMLEIATESPWFLPLWTREIANDRKPMREYLRRKADTKIFQKFAITVREGQANNLINPNLIPEMLFISLFSTMFISLLSRENWANIYDTEIPLPGLIEHIKSMMMDGILINNEKNPKKK